MKTVIAMTIVLAACGDNIVPLDAARGRRDGGQVVTPLDSGTRSVDAGVDGDCGGNHHSHHYDDHQNHGKHLGHQGTIY